MPPRFSQCDQEQCEKVSARFGLSSGNSRAGNVSAPVDRNSHQTFSLLKVGMCPARAGRRMQGGVSHRFVMIISRYSLGTTIVPSSALFMRAISA